MLPVDSSSRSNVEVSVYPAGCKSTCAGTIEYKVVCGYWYIALGCVRKLCGVEEMKRNEFKWK